MLKEILQKVGIMSNSDTVESPETPETGEVINLGRKPVVKFAVVKVIGLHPFEMRYGIVVDLPSEGRAVVNIDGKDHEVALDTVSVLADSFGSFRKKIDDAATHGKRTYGWCSEVDTIVSRIDAPEPTTFDVEVTVTYRAKVEMSRTNLRFVRNGSTISRKDLEVHLKNSLSTSIYLDSDWSVVDEISKENEVKITLVES